MIEEMKARAQKVSRWAIGTVKSGFEEAHGVGVYIIHREGDFTVCKMANSSDADLLLQVIRDHQRLLESL